MSKIFCFFVILATFSFEEINAAPGLLGLPVEISIGDTDLITEALYPLNNVVETIDEIIPIIHDEYTYDEFPHFWNIFDLLDVLREKIAIFGAYDNFEQAIDHIDAVEMLAETHPFTTKEVFDEYTYDESRHDENIFDLLDVLREIIYSYGECDDIDQAIAHVNAVESLAEIDQFTNNENPHNWTIFDLLDLLREKISSYGENDYAEEAIYALTIVEALVERRPFTNDENIYDAHTYDENIFDLLDVLKEIIYSFGEFDDIDKVIAYVNTVKDLAEVLDYNFNVIWARN